MRHTIACTVLVAASLSSPSLLLAAKRGTDGTAEAPQAVGMKGKLKLLPVRPVEVTHFINGRVATVMVKEGERVKQGQPLVTYVDGDVRRRLELARQNFDALLTDGDETQLGEARRDLALLEKDAENLTLLAPASGTIAKINVAAGKRVGKGTVAMEMKAEDSKARDAEVVVLLTDAQMQQFKGVKLLPRALVKADGEKNGRDVTVTVELSRAPRKHGSDVKLLIEAQNKEEG